MFKKFFLSIYLVYGVSQSGYSDSIDQIANELRTLKKIVAIQAAKIANLSARVPSQTRFVELELKAFDVNLNEVLIESQFSQATAYTDNQGKWRLRFNITLELSKTMTIGYISVEGVKFSYYQAVSFVHHQYHAAAHTQKNTNKIHWQADSVQPHHWPQFSGDVALEKKPEWVDLNLLR